LDMTRVRLARATDLTVSSIQMWMDDMASSDLALSTMRSRQSTLSSFCSWLVKRGVLAANPIAAMDRPPHRMEPPRQVPTPARMDALIAAAQHRQRPHDIAIFLIMRYTGMRRESVATLQVRHLDGTWGLRRVRVKGGQTRDLSLPESVMTYLHSYVERLALAVGQSGSDRAGDTAILVSVGTADHRKEPSIDARQKHLAALQNRWAAHWLPDAKPHGLRHGVAMEVLERQHDLEQVRALLGHARIDMTQIYTMIRPLASEVSSVVL
ncbi:MAG: tyrosine-type recombinase/integrase, partial [Nitrospiraceae bacterium]